MLYKIIFNNKLCKEYCDLGLLLQTHTAMSLFSAIENIATSFTEKRPVTTFENTIIFTYIKCEIQTTVYYRT